MRKKILMIVWNNFYKDNRVRKKYNTLSKEFNVDVLNVTYGLSYEFYNVNNYNNGIIITINCKNRIQWLYYRLFKNKSFYQNLFKKFIENDEKYDVIDCNDPDTLFLGMLFKNKYRSKVVYDSHEYWKGTRRFETSILYTLYTLIGNTLQYYKEKRYARFTDYITTVSPEILDKLELEYSMPKSVIYNFSSKIEFEEEIKREKRIVFIGQKIRPGVNKVLQDFYDKGYAVDVIGEMPEELSFAKYHGFLNSDKYLPIIRKAKYGLVSTKVNCENVKMSLPNKLFTYIQAGIEPVINKDMVSCNNFIDLIHLGKIKAKNVNWEAQEDKLLEIYKNL